MSFVFGIGLPKTGTSSLHSGLCRLGFRSIYNVGVANKAIKKAIRERKPILFYLRGYNAFTDAPFYEHYRTLDRQYPGCRFIYTTRDIESWMTSQRIHNEIWNKLNPGKPLRTFGPKQEQKWRQKWSILHYAIRKYFVGRADFLELDVCAGQGYEALCPFLNMPVLGESFPHQNETKQKIVMHGIKDLR
jgi:Sulfotransferase domain